MPEADPVFEEQRPRLARLAYRMLGTLADADDVLQDAYLRWSRGDRSGVESPGAYLSSVVTRLCIDRRQSIEARKEAYVGPWLPEPIVEPDEAAPDRRLEAAESISMAFLVVLESLSPIERAAYLLRRAFDHGYDEIASILGRSEAACRQLVSRAEGRILERRPRFEADPAEAERLTGAFLGACSTGDMDGLLRLLAPDAVVVSDGGGKASAALAPIRGADRVARFFLGVTRKAPPEMAFRRVLVNGRPGLAAVLGGEVFHVLTFDVDDGRIAACFIIRNPDKLARVHLGDGQGWGGGTPDVDVDEVARDPGISGFQGPG
ncbi:ECF RNA polymerase sigma factor SigJ [Aquisphaera giovannonii]|uniref:ECF RNA polymerase sigma factor SigJ n=1 Tax=Aquisphaera giovannonii TaxID=406548 RepID=A0A5B9WCQ6_9BACT|nr:RNA polymerase sigma-70 factor [Aquisphaera giovannonii]QEH38019.1 ECF RNA polymerase sigma factor SigJ [Aquisphaera giovannonii]